jgi:hypothetical protein
VTEGKSKRPTARRKTPDRDEEVDQSAEPDLSDTDRELLSLADEVVMCAESARNLVLRADTQKHVARSGDVEAAKRRQRRRMERMLLAWRGLRDENATPYRDARMLLTEGILFYGGALRAACESARRGMPLFTPMGRMRTRGGVVVTVSHAAPGEATQRRYAQSVAAIVARHYPKLAEKMGEADRIERIRAAIESAAKSAKRKPLKLIAAAWDGIEKRSRDPVRWGVDWAEHRAGNITRWT